MSLYTFSDDVLKMSDKVSMDQFPKLNAENYVTGGSTSLLKAINVALSYHKKDGFKYTVVIMTDGRENSSGSKYSIQGTYKLISTLKEKGWTFVFLGTDLDTWMVGQSLGITYNLKYNHTDEGILRAVRSVGHVISTSSSMEDQNEMFKELTQPTEEDFTSTLNLSEMSIFASAGFGATTEANVLSAISLK